MSVQAITLALALRNVSPAEKLVLLALANYADENMVCWPSQKTLADDCCMTDRGVRGVLAQLEEKRLLSRTQRRRADGYRASDSFVLRLSPERGSAERPSPEDASAERGSNLTGTKRQFSPERGSGLTTLEPPVEPPLEPSKRRARDVDAEFDEFWAAWPDKRSKGAARKAYPAARRKTSQAEILAGVPNVTETHAWRGGHRVHASTWLNDERWADPPENHARAPPMTAGMVAAVSDEIAFRNVIEKLNGNAPDPGNHLGNQGALVALPQARQVHGR